MNNKVLLIRGHKYFVKDEMKNTVIAEFVGLSPNGDMILATNTKTLRAFGSVTEAFRRGDVKLLPRQYQPTAGGKPMQVNTEGRKSLIYHHMINRRALIAAAVFIVILTFSLIARTNEIVELKTRLAQAQASIAGYNAMLKAKAVKRVAP